MADRGVISHARLVDPKRGVSGLRIVEGKLYLGFGYLPPGRVMFDPKYDGPPCGMDFCATCDPLTRATRGF